MVNAQGQWLKTIWKKGFNIFKHFDANQNILDPILFELWISKDKKNSLWIKRELFNFQKFITQKVFGLERSG